jgi:predicted RNA-binding protein YlxR (DUF448 family)
LAKSELMRIVAVREGEGRSRRAVLDLTSTLPGRGAYLCRGAVSTEPAADCLALANRRGGIARALRCAVTIAPELVESEGR